MLCDLWDASSVLNRDFSCLSFFSPVPLCKFKCVSFVMDSAKSLCLFINLQIRVLQLRETQFCRACGVRVTAGVTQLFNVLEMGLLLFAFRLV